MDADKAQEQLFESKLEQYKQIQETQRALIKSINIFGTQALRGIFLLNGGGAIAVLAHMKSAQANPESVLFFAYGALSAVLATGSSYLTELFGALYYRGAADIAISGKDCDPSDAYQKIGLFFLFVSVTLFLVSCILFAAQVYGIVESFKEFKLAAAAPE